jgi:hypothetical protein
MKYDRDDKYEKSCKLVDYLLDSKKELPRSMKNISEDDMLDLLIYNIIKKEEHIKLQRERMQEYQSVFDAMSKFIKPKGLKIYG